MSEFLNKEVCKFGAISEQCCSESFGLLEEKNSICPYILYKCSSIPELSNKENILKFTINILTNLKFIQVFYNVS